MKVLIAEDHPENRQILSDVLNAAGYDVVLVENGPAALIAARQHLPDLAILDVNMPGKDGFAVCEELKQSHETAQIPVIILTAQSDIDSRVRGLGLGAEDFVAKPFSPKELLARVDARLRTKAETDELRRQRDELRKQRLYMRKTFERFVSPDIVDALMRNPESAQLGGALREITVMFADMEGFTSLSERIDPTTLLGVLNQYHTLMVKYIKQNGGTIDKFLGDGIMAIYNAPVELEAHPLRAVVTAYQIRQALSSFQQQLSPEFRLSVNFGIHTGSALVGNVGSEDVMNYTAIGDCVNLAQRLEELSVKGAITISEVTYKQVESYVDVIPDGLRQLRGREEMVKTYQVTDLKDN